MVIPVFFLLPNFDRTRGNGTNRKLTDIIGSERAQARRERCVNVVTKQFSLNQEARRMEHSVNTNIYKVRVVKLHRRHV